MTSSPPNKITYTDEQRRIINAPIGETKKVLAFAGTGKTQTLAAMAEKNLDKKLLYLAYNKAMADDARNRMPAGNVKTKTSHAFAWALLSPEEREKFHEDANKGDSEEIKVLTGSDVVGHNWKLLHIIGKFCTSDADTFTPDHLSRDLRDAIELNTALANEGGRGGNLEDKKRNLKCDEGRRLLLEASKVFDRMRDANDSEAKFHQEHYLKMMLLNGRFVEKLNSYDAILLDEAQDTNPALAGAIRETSSAVTAVGDPWQAIYGFRGARDYLATARGKTYHLTRSFRFGEKVADIANQVLYMSTSEKKDIVGGGPETIILPPGDKPIEREQHLFLTRTNVAAIREAIRARKAGVPYKLVKEITYKHKKLIRAVAALLNGDPSVWKYCPAEMRRYIGKKDEFLHYVAEFGEPETKLACALWGEYRSETWDTVNETLRRQAARREDACVLISTAHGAKGLEHDNVVLGADFSRFGEIVEAPNIDLVTKPKIADVQEINLVYVAVTRARKKLHINQEIKTFLGEFCPHLGPIDKGLVPDA